MADEPMTSTEAPAGPPRRRQRLTAAARRSSILDAARKAFVDTGDMTGTTVRVIAARAGISEGAIYRHFESKEQLFVEAVVEPLRQAIDDLVAQNEVIDREEPITTKRELRALEDQYRQLVSTLEEIIPLLGLVLFGDPQIAQRFYRESFTAAMDRLAAVWREVAGRNGLELASPDISARAVMGIALILALESHHNGAFDRDRGLELASTGTLSGFFPRRRTSGRG